MMMVLGCKVAAMPFCLVRCLVSEAQENEEGVDDGPLAALIAALITALLAWRWAFIDTHTNTSTLGSFVLLW